jgi:hypothetical protein
MSLFAVLFLTMSLWACGGVSGSTPTSESDVGASAATEVTLAADKKAALEARVKLWAALIASVQDSGADNTAEIAAFLWPRDNAQARAAEYQQMWSAGPDSSEVVEWRDFDHIVRISAGDAGNDAVVLIQNRLTGSDGTVTAGLEAVTWTLQEGQWYRTTSFWVPDPVSGARQPLDKTVRVKGMTWSPLSVEEVHTLTVDAGQAGEGRVLLVITMYVSNIGEDPIAPAGFSLGLYDGEGGRLSVAKVFDTLFPGSARAREVLLDAGMDERLTYCFEAAEGLDLSTLQYEVKSAD